MAEVTLSTVVNLALVKMKWKEQYVSEGLNRKVAPSQPPGVYQGLRLTENISSPRQVEISPDADTNYHMAVYQSTTGYSLTYWDIAGTSIILDLSSASLDSQDVVVGLEMDYTIGVDTTAVWMAFPVADWDALPAARKNEIIVLGTIAVPAAATNITTAMISFDRATYAWRSLSKGALAWSPLARNGDFEQAEDGTANVWYWTLLAAAGTGAGTALVTSTDPDRNSLALTLACTSTGSATFSATQNVGIPVTPTQLGMVKLSKKNLLVPSAGSIDIDLIFSDDTGADSTTVSVNVDGGVVDGVYSEVLSIFEVPAGVTALSRIVIGGTPTYGSVADAIHIDDVQVWIETEGQRNDLQHGVSGDLEVMGRISMREPGALYSALSFEASYDSVANSLNIDDRDGSGGLTVDINGDLSAIDIDATSVTADVATVGAGLIGNEVDADLARVTAAAGVAAGIEYTLMWESIPAGSQGYRQYVSNSGAIVETVNAKWNNTTNLWTHDQTGADALKTTKSIIGMLIERRTTTAGTWNDAQWDASNIDNTSDPLTKIFLSDGATQVKQALVIEEDPAANGTFGDLVVIKKNTDGGSNAAALRIEKIPPTGTGSTGRALEVSNGPNSFDDLAVFVSDGTGNAIVIDKNGPSSGDGISINVDSQTTGQGIDLDYDGNNDALNVDVGGTEVNGQGLVVTDFTATARSQAMVQFLKTNVSNISPLLEVFGIGGSKFSVFASGAHEVLIDGGPSSAFTINSPDADALANADALLTLASNTSDLVDYENIECISSGSDINSRHEANGDWHTDTGLYTTGAGDYAECMVTEAAASNYEEGDLMVISSAGKVDKSTAANSTAIIGVYSTNPSVLGNNPISDLLMDQGTLEVNSWSWEKGAYPNEMSWNHIEIDGDQTANYTAGTRCRMDAPYNNKGFKVNASSYDDSVGKTSVYFNQTYPNLPPSTEVYYDVPTRDCIPVGMLGLVPTKCITENGTISPGDLLVSSSTAGYAMKAVAPAIGSVIGRAYETLVDTGTQDDMALIDCMISI